MEEIIINFHSAPHVDDLPVDTAHGILMSQGLLPSFWHFVFNQTPDPLRLIIEFTDAY